MIPEDFYLNLLVFLSAHYLFAVIVFWIVQSLHVRTLQSLLIALRSPKNRSYVETDLNNTKKDTKLVIVWPYLLLKQVLNEFRQTK